MTAATLLSAAIFYWALNFLYSLGCSFFSWWVHTLSVGSGYLALLMAALSKVLWCLRRLFSFLSSLARSLLSSVILLLAAFWWCSTTVLNLIALSLVLKISCSLWAIILRAFSSFMMIFSYVLINLSCFLMLRAYNFLASKWLSLALCLSALRSRALCWFLRKLSYCFLWNSFRSFLTFSTRLRMFSSSISSFFLWASGLALIHSSVGFFL